MDAILVLIHLLVPNAMMVTSKTFLIPVIPVHLPALPVLLLPQHVPPVPKKTSPQPPTVLNASQV